MNFDDWMRVRNPKYHATDDTVALRELRDCWRTAEYNSERAQERELLIELMRDKCRKVGVGTTAECELYQLRKLAEDAYEAWDSDKETQVGKLLRAMLDGGFRKTYRPDLATPNGGSVGPAASRTVPHD